MEVERECEPNRAQVPTDLASGPTVGARGEPPREGQAAGSVGTSEDGDAAESPDTTAAQSPGQTPGRKQKKHKQRRSRARARDKDDAQGEDDDDLALREAQERNVEQYQQAFQQLAVKLSLVPTEGVDEAGQGRIRTVMEMARAEAQGLRPGEDESARNERWTSVLAGLKGLQQAGLV